MNEDINRPKDKKPLLSGKERQEIVREVGRLPIWSIVLPAIVVGVLFYFLDERLTIGPNWLIPAIIGVLVVVSVVVWFTEMHRASHILGHITITIMTFAVVSGVVLLIRSLLQHEIKGISLLSAAASLWALNIIVFALWYWLLDGYGPAIRHRHGYKPTDFIFPQVVVGAEFRTGWTPNFLDYLFLAFNSSTAFSPTDTMVIARRAKMLMMLQSLMSLVIVAVLAARAINILPSGN